MLPTIDGIVDCIESASFKGKRDVCSKLKSIRTTIDAIQAKIQADSIVLSPIPSMAYANNRNQVQLRRSVSPETVVPTPKSSNSKRKVQHTIVSKSKKRPNTKTSDAVLQYPTPSNGVLYTPKEFVDIIASKPKKVRRPIMLQMIQNKTVSVQERSLYSVLQRVADEGYHTIPIGWHLVGRKPIATHEQVQQMTSSLSNQPGSSLGRAEIASALHDMRKQQLVDHRVNE